MFTKDSDQIIRVNRRKSGMYRLLCTVAAKTVGLRKVIFGFGQLELTQRGLSSRTVKIL